MKTQTLFKLYIAMALLYVIALCLHEDLAWAAKPLLLPPLIAAVAGFSVFPTRRLLLLALVFSWFGDVTLMFAPHSQWYFICGLLLFLIAHLMYIALFAKIKRSGSGTFYALYAGWVAVAVYLCAMLYVLFPKLGALQIPVVVYAVVISTMLAMALLGLFRWPSPSNRYIFAGAVCFVLSDSLLAFDKFHTPLPMASVWIMSTYLAAQGLLSVGILNQNKRQQESPAAC